MPNSNANEMQRKLRKAEWKQQENNERVRALLAKRSQREAAHINLSSSLQRSANRRVSLLQLYKGCPPVVVLILF